MAARTTVLITAGGTREPIDDVRVVTNSSTGRFGAAFARAFRELGCEVVVVGSRDMLRHEDWLADGTHTYAYGSFEDLDSALDEALKAYEPDLFLMAAAVADYSPIAHKGKLRSTDASMTIQMSKNPKILRGLRDRVPQGCTLVGFKLLSGVSQEELAAVAQAQREGADLDLTLANDLQRLTRDQHPVLWVDAEGATPIEGHRETVAKEIAARLYRRVQPGAPALPLPESKDAPPHRRWLEVPASGAAQGIDGPLSEALTDPKRALHGPAAYRLRPGCLTLDLGPEDARVLTEALEGLPLLPEQPQWLVWAGQLVAATDAQHTSVWDFGILPPGQWQHLLTPNNGPVVLHTHAPDAWRNAGWRQDNRQWIAPWNRPDRQSASSVCLVDRRTQRVLLGARTTAPYTGLWAFPGGKVEAGEGSVDAGLRELKEETGIELSNWQTPAHEMTLYAGADPVWEIRCHVYWTAGAPPASRTKEFTGTWLPLAHAGVGRTLTPGTRAVLDALPFWLYR